MLIHFKYAGKEWFCTNVDYKYIFKQVVFMFILKVVNKGHSLWKSHLFPENNASSYLRGQEKTSTVAACIAKVCTMLIGRVLGSSPVCDSLPVFVHEH